MKFKVSSTALSVALQSVSRVISSKNTLQILDNILFKIEGDELLLTASDLETTLTTKVELTDVEGGCLVAVPARKLIDTLKEFSEQPLLFDIDESSMNITLTSAYGKYSFVGLQGEEYPSIPTISDTTRGFTLPVEALLNGINKTIFAASSDELRPIMTGMLFDIRTEGLTFVATDAQRLVRLRNSAVKSSLNDSFVLPPKPASVLKAILPRESGDVQVVFDGKNIAFTLSRYTMFCRQIEGVYPRYEAVIPAEDVNTNHIVVDRTLLLNALRRVALFASQSTNQLKLSIEDESTLKISAQDIDFSQSAEETLACHFTGVPMAIGFKSQFLIEMLNNIASKEVLIELSDSARAGLILPCEQDDDEEVLMLIMPMYLSE